MKKVFRALLSYRAMAILLVIYAVAMGIATFVENKYGTSVARHWIYNNWAFYILQFLLIVNFVGIAARQKLLAQRKWASLVFHYAFAVILLGAFVTHLTGREGVMHIRTGETSSVLLDPENPYEIAQELPFSIELKEFRLVRYPGSNSPSSFESDVILRRPGQTPQERLIYMNNVLHVGSYRIYQASYDSDEQGTVLSVNRDLAGMIITYTGYILLIAGMLLALFHKHSRFRTLGRQLGKGAMILAAGLLLNTAQTYAQDGTSGATAVAPTDQSERLLEEQEQQRVEQAMREAMARQGHAPRELDREREKDMATMYATTMAIDPEVAKAFGKLITLNAQGRAEPVDTYASRILRKIYRKDAYDGLNADQVLLGTVIQPNVWSRVPFIRVGNDQLRQKAGGGDAKGYLAFIDVLDDNGDYIFTDEVEATYYKPVRERNKYDKELLKLDEKINILHALFNGQMLPIFPGEPAVHGVSRWFSPGDDLSSYTGQDSMFVNQIFRWFGNESTVSAESGEWQTPLEIVGMIATYQNAKAQGYDISPRRIDAEMLYNRLNVFKWSGFLFMGFGLLLILVLTFKLVNDSKTWKYLAAGLIGMILAVFIWQTFGIALRWYISGRPPVSNAYESMIFVGWAAAIAGLAFGTRSRMAMALAVFLSGVLMFVSNLNWMDPEITPLVPVLKSPWLLIHVATITGSYGFFGICFLLGLISLLMMALKNRKNALSLDRQVRELTIINEMAMIIGIILLTTGTFLGAVWANESWGRYWGWDPKETWALITMIVYAFVIHARFIPALRSTFAFNTMSVVGLLSVLMTFFGVNYYLSGMHSYGGDSAPGGLYAIWVVYGIAGVIAVLAWRKRKRWLPGKEQ